MNWKAWQFLASVDSEMPWHFRFFPQYKMTNGGNLGGYFAARARLGKKAGLKYVYIGNLPHRQAGVR